MIFNNCTSFKKHSIWMFNKRLCLHFFLQIEDYTLCCVLWCLHGFSTLINDAIKMHFVIENVKNINIFFHIYSQAATIGINWNANGRLFPVIIDLFDSSCKWDLKFILNG